MRDSSSHLTGMEKSKMKHSFEEIRNVTLDVLAGRTKGRYELSQYEHLLVGVADELARRESNSSSTSQNNPTIFREEKMSREDRELFLEVFWSLFREGIITLGLNDSNRQFPFFRISEFGRKIVQNQQAYFFHDVASYESLICNEVPKIDDTTVLYLKESMQAFRVGCILASTVMLGVATEHTFLLLMEDIENNPKHASTFAPVAQQRTILQKVNKFWKLLEPQLGTLPGPLKEDLETRMMGILSVIRNFRNQSGHPSGQIIDREQTYVLLQLFVSYCKKMYQLRDHFS